MEKSRAIEVLKPLANSFVDYANITMKEEDDDTAEALEMAIEALKAQLSKEGTTSDPISRQWLLDCINDGWIKFDTDKDANRFIHLVRDIAPSVQPEPHEGHWIEGGIYRDVIECNCSECGQLMTTAATVRMNFCPNCGAKMTISTK